MRLHVLEHGHRRRVRWYFALVARLSGAETADLPKTLLYRPEFFGRALLDLGADVMRGPSHWTAGEREYLAMVTAQLHKCAYGIDMHAELARLASVGEIDASDPASMRPEFAAVLEFVEQVTIAPSMVRSYDTTSLADVPDEALRDALQVNFVWNIVDRLANAFDFQLQDGQLEAGSRVLHRLRYRFPRILNGRRRRSPHTRPIIGDRRARLVARVRDVVLDPVARTDPATRSAAANGDVHLAEPWVAYAEKVREQSHLVTDADIHRLVAAGRNEDEIFEVTIAAAVGAAQRSLDAGLRAITAR